MNLYQKIKIYKLRLPEIQQIMKASTVLFIHKVCPFAERARITILEKQVPHSLQQVSLTNKQPIFTETYLKAFAHDPSSNGKVPILIDGETILTESDLISWYLAEKYSTGMQLIPADAFDRARLRHFIQSNSKIIGLFYGFKGYNSKSKQNQEKHVNSLNKAFEDLEKQIALPYALGSDFSLADVFLCPWFTRWPAIERVSGVQIPARFNKIHQWCKNVADRDSIKSIREPDEYYVEGYKGYFD